MPDIELDNFTFQAGAPDASASCTYKGAKGSACVISISAIRASSRMAMKLTIATGTSRTGANSSVNSIRPDGADFLKLHRGPARRGVSLMARRDRQKIATQLRQGVQRARSALDAFIFKQAARQLGARIGIAFLCSRVFFVDRQ